MENIKFIDRKEELAMLNNIETGNFFLVLTGRRRIGKTMLLRKAFPNAIYLFIWPDKSIEWILEQISSEYSLPKFKSFSDILSYLSDMKKIVIIDEFQNFLNIDKSIYGEIQKIIDDRKLNKKFLKLAAAGSSYSLMNKVLNSVASPLYGRRTNEIMLGHLPVKDLFLELNIPLEEFVKLWAVFEGVPYYYELINKKIFSEENIIKIVLSKNSQLKEEGKAVLSVEFGKDSRTYNTVLTAISEGKTKLNEIASLFDNKKNEVVKYLDLLRKDFSLVRKITPITENPAKSKEGRYEIIDNFLSFWFYFIDRTRNYIEQERFSEVESNFNNNFKAFLGRKFEKFIIQMIKDKVFFKGIEFNKIGRQWGRISHAEKDKNQYEIDIIALNEKNKEIIFCECKWENKVNAAEIAKELLEKSKNVNWENEKRKKYLAIFAKSFSKKIDNFEGEKVYCFDLKDIEMELKKRL